ncbi:hypothetical protein [Streptomyces sp. NPDC029004]|uniref:hypothetical protein n=1 Tax=Streptomyces sp. NPDC029004 TaxID=3154490 RepID=UPI0033E51BA0
MRMNSVLAAGALAMGAVLAVPASAQAAAEQFAFYTSDAKRGGYVSGTLVSGGSSWNKCSYAKIKNNSGSYVQDKARDGKAAVAWLVYTDCKSGAVKWRELGRASGYGKVDYLPGTPVYNAKKAKVAVCLSSKKNCRYSRY